MHGTRGVGGGGGLRAARQRGVSMPQIVGVGATGSVHCAGDGAGAGATAAVPAVTQVRTGGRRWPDCPAMV